MKNSKSFSLLLTVAVTLACVMSCDEQDEKLEASTKFTSNESSNRAINRVSAVEFKGTEGDPLDKQTAKKWTANFRKENSNPDEVLAHYFGFEIIQKILSQSGCVGIRIYYALDDNGEKKLLLVGVDSKGENLLPLEDARTGDEGDIVADYSYPCPDYCPGQGL